MIACYREAIQRRAAAGLRVTIENECHANILSTPAEVRHFFAELRCGTAVNLTWDVQNMWQIGTFPSLQGYPYDDVLARDLAFVRREFDGEIDELPA